MNIHKLRLYEMLSHDTYLPRYDVPNIRHRMSQGLLPSDRGLIRFASVLQETQSAHKALRTVLLVISVLVIACFILAFLWGNDLYKSIAQGATATMMVVAALAVIVTRPWGLSDEASWLIQLSMAHHYICRLLFGESDDMQMRRYSAMSPTDLTAAAKSRLDELAWRQLVLQGKLKKGTDALESADMDDALDAQVQETGEASDAIAKNMALFKLTIETFEMVELVPNKDYRPYFDTARARQARERQPAEATA